MTASPELLSSMGVDPERYEGTLLRTWGSPDSPQYSVSLRPRVDQQELQDLVAGLARGLKPLKSADPKGASSYGLVALADLHFGQDSDAVDVQVRHAMELAVTLVDDMLAHPRWGVGRLGLLLNGDILHVDAVQRTTTKGTSIEDASLPYPGMFEATLAGVSGIINWMAKRRPVDVFVVTGNHDFHAAYHLGKTLEVGYADQDRVRVIGGMDKFLYHRWGASLMLFHHGDTAKDLSRLERLMTTERRREWGETLYDYYYTGHIHTPTKVRNHYGLAALVPRGPYAKNQGFPPELQGGIGHVFDLVRGRVGEVARHWTAC